MIQIAIIFDQFSIHLDSQFFCTSDEEKSDISVFTHS